jgi:L-threonylcarbamoyladenylate synthase
MEAVVAALRAGEPVILPADTVYGLCADPFREEPVRRAYALKGREEGKPAALFARDVDTVVASIPELRGRAEEILRALLPGPYTLVLPNPARRLPWLGGARTDTIGVRVPVLPEPSRAVLAEVGAVMATSANAAGGPDPRVLADVPPPIREGCGAELDVGELPGTPSTVVDLTGGEPRVLREGAVPADEALRRIREATT